MYRYIFRLIAALAAIGTGLTQAQSVSGTRGGNRAVMNFNPEISVIIDGSFYGHSGHESLSHASEEIRGFGHVHTDDEHGHDHDHGFEKGFNLRHLELMLQADIDPYFKGWAIIAVEEHGAEIEEAVVLTTALPAGFQIKLGKFFSDFSRLNAQHAHEWNFVDAPLIHQLLLGDHGINEKGVQLSWMAPTPFYLILGAEVLQGENETAFKYHGDGPLPERDGPRLMLGWLKAAPNLYGPHALQFGLFAARGVRQEEHLGPMGHEDIGSHYLDGHQDLWGADLVYKYAPPRAYGHGTLTLEGGYLTRRKDLELVAHNNPALAGLLGRSLVEEQNGLYAQAIYGFAPRWRLGLRGEMLGLTNQQTKPSGARTAFDESYRATAMLDWTLTEFSRLRLQGTHGRYDLDDGKEDISEVFLQAVFSIGAHGAHRF